MVRRHSKRTLTVVTDVTLHPQPSFPSQFEKATGPTHMEYAYSIYINQMSVLKHCSCFSHATFWLHRLRNDELVNLLNLATKHPSAANLCSTLHVPFALLEEFEDPQ